MRISDWSSDVCSSDLKRPFFTENQGLFEYTTPSDYSQLLYTRRVGGPADDGEGSCDITAAVKLNGSFRETKYGVFVADESGEAVRLFGALRRVRDLNTQCSEQRRVGIECVNTCRSRCSHYPYKQKLQEQR